MQTRRVSNSLTHSDDLVCVAVWVFSAVASEGQSVVVWSAAIASFWCSFAKRLRNSRRAGGGRTSPSIAFHLACPIGGPLRALGERRPLGSGPSGVAETRLPPDAGFRSRLLTVARLSVNSLLLALPTEPRRSCGVEAGAGRLGDERDDPHLSSAGAQQGVRLVDAPDELRPLPSHNARRNGALLAAARLALETGLGLQCIYCV